MQLPKNLFKQKLIAGELQFGVWHSLGGPAVAEMLAVAGYDWILIDTEHSPVEVTGVLPALQMIAAYPDTSAIVRPASNDTVLIKRHLDQGAQTLLIPYVQNAEEAAEAVAAVRYPPVGRRGVAGLTRASRFGSVPDYARQAEQELCVIVQVETMEAIENLDAISGTDGIDAVFIGPADLAASMGYPGKPNHPAVLDQVRLICKRLADKNVRCGILTLNPKFAQECIDMGVDFIASAMDSSLLMKGLAENRTSLGTKRPQKDGAPRS
ncbi:aldolase/citrate lyase family protein [Cognatishimia sp. SS12]|uniref:HpcH/HpaI aldolase family protein n=1 Tax=Cognatishimia sp. SS12 TaxID=2979465 RepID=UPI00232B9862|nr:aldolase/citrate lyase family protein [Cognatishimia sp. SS12]MDC0738068.1 aldolase/citrate lyase family protein [Cognatishimia sp. SS12]